MTAPAMEVEESLSLFPVLICQAVERSLRKQAAAECQEN